MAEDPIIIELIETYGIEEDYQDLLDGADTDLESIMLEELCTDDVFEHSLHNPDILDDYEGKELEFMTIIHKVAVKRVWGE